MSSVQSNIIPSEEDQKRILEESKNVINVQAFHMKRAIDANKLMDAINHASNMLGELRTGLLEPKAYYDLYNYASQHLRDLEMYLEEDKHGKSVSELYKLVQYAANILPRLYLLITVGAVYIKVRKAPAHEVLKDLIEMCQGVQHPTRGLFLRTYLADMTKDKLPEKGSIYAENGGGDINDCIDFILKNFVEMNKLWVRMQHQVVVRDKSKRDDERKQLSILVGKNIARISSLEGVDGEIYKTKILPKLLKQIVQCKDRLAQQSLLVILIQAIPDEWHLKTLKRLFRNISKVEDKVDVKQIVISLIERLGDYIKNENLKKNKSFPLFFESIKNLITIRTEMPVEASLAMLNSLVEIVVKCYNNNKEYIDKILAFANEYFEQNNPETNSRSVSEDRKSVV